MPRSRAFRYNPRWLGVWGLVYLCAITCVTTTVSENRLSVLLTRAVARGNGYPDLDAQIFGPKTIFTGVIKAERFTRVIGFWMFLDAPHRPGTLPVVLVHGHSTGPRPFRSLLNALDRTRYEPWLCFYPTGLSIARSAAMLRQQLSEMAARYKTEAVAIVAYSMGGLVTRQALRPYEDGTNLPRIPLFIGVANPWGGSEETKFESKRSFAPGSWEDVADGSAFLAHLYDDPLPSGTAFHYIYGLGGKPDKRLGEVNDGILSKASLTRPETMAEADSVTFFEDADHKGIIKDQRVMRHVAHLLSTVTPPSRR